MTQRLDLLVSRDDYQKHAGASWPTYAAFVSGMSSVSPEIAAEIAQFKARLTSAGNRFPISSATACQNKWAWSTLYLNNLATASCHRVVPEPITADQLSDFHNIPRKINERQMMLEGKWPGRGCEYCRDIEYAGGFSDRQHSLELPGLMPPELEYDPTATSISPTIVEIFAQNTCNLACTYCNSGLSSKIAAENRKFGDFNSKGVIIPVTEVPDLAEEYFQRFLVWLSEHVHTLKRLHLLGGETFLQTRLMDGVLGILEATPCPDLELCVFSNLNVPDKLWDRYTGLLHSLQERGHIKVFDLTASIDCWGPESEYARSGLDLVDFERRFAWASSQGPWLRLNVNQTMTVLTMHTMPGLIERVNHYSQTKDIGHYFQFYTGLQMFQHPKIYAYDFWQPVFARIYNEMKTDTVEQQEAVRRMQGHESLLKQVQEHDVVSIEKMHVYLDELDRRRGTSWRPLFPYLLDYDKTLA